MSQENETTSSPKITETDVISQINAYRDTITEIALKEELSFDVVFNALAQTSVSFIFDFLLLSQREITDSNVNEAVSKFGSHVNAVALAGLANMREWAQEDQNSQD